MNDSVIIGRYVQGTGRSSREIEAFGTFSHTATVLPDGSIIDARDDKPPAYLNGKLTDQVVPLAGVRRRPGNYLDSEPYIDIALPCTAIQAARVYERLESQIGKPYDSLGIWLFAKCVLFNLPPEAMQDRNWRDLSAWFCDELRLWAVEAEGCVPEQVQPVFRFTPGQELCVEVGAGAKVVKRNRWPVSA